MFSDGDFEVLDECTGEEDPSQASMETDERKGANEKQEAPAESAKAEENVDAPSKEAEVEVVPAKPALPNNPDSTNQAETPKEDTGKDDAIHPDASDIVVESADGATKMEAENADNGKATDSAVDSILPEHAWYEEKLNSKTAIVKERLSKLARVLELSYPTYKPWLEHNNTSIFHLDPPQRCPLDKPYTNRWKFICSRKPVQETTNEEEDSAEGTVNKKLKTVWRLGPTDGSGDKTDNASQYPPFVMRVVKVFEEFIQNVEQTSEEEQVVADQVSPEVPQPTTEEKSSNEVVPNEVSASEEPEASIEDVKVDDDISAETSNAQSGFIGDRSDNWFWLLVRSNSKDELMIFATGKKIRESTMQKLKETFETGPGKDCNVKSLYCKSIDTKGGNTALSNKTFLAGTEALDETVGGIKIQLAPKTNFWCNASGVEQLGTAVSNMLSPLQKTTLLEVGCGLGLLGLMVAPKCRKVIGLDAPSEVEEAEMTRELNNVENASFITGESNELMTNIKTYLKNTRAAAIVNGNTKLGRDIEVMTALRQIPSLRRVVMITTLTKQSVRAMLELVRPSDSNLGNPFMPLRAMLVDTLPTGPHFEVVVRMERLNLDKIGEPWFWDHVKFRAGLSPNEQPRKNPPAKNENDSVAVPAIKSATKVSDGTSNDPSLANSNRRSKQSIRANKRNKMRKRRAAVRNIVLGAVTGVVRNPPANAGKTAAMNLVKNPMASTAKTLKQSPRGANRSNAKNAVKDKTEVSQGSSKSGVDSPASPDPLNPVKVAKSSKAWTTSLKKNPLAKVQPSRRGPRLSGAQKRKRHLAMLEAQRQGGEVAGNANYQGPAKKRMRGNVNQNDLRDRLSDGRLVHEVHDQRILLNIAQQRLGDRGQIVDNDTAKQLQSVLNMVIDQTNKLHNQLPRSVWDRIAPPNNGQPAELQDGPANANAFRDRFIKDVGPRDILVTRQNRNFAGNLQPPPLFNRPPVDRSKIMPAGMSGHESLGGQQAPRGISANLQGRDFRNNQGNNWSPAMGVAENRQQGANKAPPIPSLMVPVARPPSPKRSLLSTPNTSVPSAKRFVPPGFSRRDDRRRESPPQSRRQSSPPRRNLPSPPRDNPYSDIFQRRSSVGHARQQQENPDFTRRAVAPSNREQASSAARPLSPSRGFTNDWKTSRGAAEQANWHQRQQGQMQQQRSHDRNTNDGRWSNDRALNSHNWNNSTSNDGFRGNNDKPIPERKDGLWLTGGGDIWSAKQPTSVEAQWGNDAPGPSRDNWNSRGNDNYRQSDNWRSSGKNDKDWTSVADKAGDSWNDGKPRWQQRDKPSGSNWGRDEKNDRNSSGNFNGPQWSDMSNQNNGEQRWTPQNEPSNVDNPGNWQGNNYAGNSWRPQNFPANFSQQQRQNNFGSFNFRGGC